MAQVRQGIDQATAVFLPRVVEELFDAGLLDGAIDASAACARGACPSRAQAVGWTGGAAFVGDVFGARPTLLGVWLAGPAWSSAPQPVLPDARLQAYARLTQAF